MTDCNQYLELASSIRQGRGFSYDVHGVLAPNLLRTPMYPLLLALLGEGSHHLLRVVVAQHLFVLLTAALVWRFVGTFSRLPVPGLIAFCIVAFDLTTMTYASYLLTETLFSLLVWTYSIVWWTGMTRSPLWTAAWSGGIWGLATLTRPISLYLGPCGLLWAAAGGIRNRRLLMRVAVAAIVGALCVGTWVLRNYRLCGSPVFSTIEGEELLHYKVALVSLPPETSVEEWTQNLRREIGEAKFDRSDPRQAVDLNRVQKIKAWELIRRSPLGVVRLVIVGLPRLYLGPNRTYLYNLLGVEHQAWDLEDVGLSGLLKSLRAIAPWELFYLGASVIYQLGLAVLAIGGVCLALRLRERRILAVAGVVAYLAIVPLGLEASARFRVPIVPGLAILAEYCLSSIRERRLA